MTILRPSNDSTPEAEPGGHERPGSITAALHHQPFRRIWIGQLASNVGTWMQNIVLGILAFQLTGEAWFIGVVTFAQLGPMLIVSPIGGAVADRFDRRRVLIGAAAIQVALSLALAAVALDDTPSKALIVAIVAGIGICASIYTPSLSAMLPTLVGRRDLQGAVALNSAAMNISRVVGPILGGAIAHLAGVPAVFAINAASYLVAVWAIATVDVDFSPKGHLGQSPFDQLREGFRIAAHDPVLKRVLLTISTFSLCSLVFIYQMPLIAERNLHVSEFTYTLLFATFAIGAALGAIAMGSWLVGVNRWITTRVALVAFAIGLTVFTCATELPAAFIGVFVAGATYFALVTALSTILQLQVDDHVRGRVMGLWMMGWAGLVPLGGLIAGPAIDAVGVNPVLLAGAVVALVLAVVLREPAGARA